MLIIIITHKIQIILFVYKDVKVLMPNQYNMFGIQHLMIIFVQIKQFASQLTQYLNIREQHQITIIINVVKYVEMMITD